MKRFSTCQKEFISACTTQNLIRGPENKILAFMKDNDNRTNLTYRD